MEFVTLPLWIGKTHSKGTDTFDIGVECVQFSAKRLALHFVEFFPDDNWTIFGICGSEKNVLKNLEMTTTRINRPRGEGQAGSLTNNLLPFQNKSV